LKLQADDGPGEQWVCNVTLLKKYSYDPDANAAEHPLYPWSENAAPIPTTPFGTVHNKHDLEALIRLAQVATLNPQTPSEHFKGATHSDYSITVPFSPNIISLEISGPNLPNLSFYDLPGVISQSSDVSTTQAQNLPVSVLKSFPLYHAAKSWDSRKDASLFLYQDLPSFIKFND
jgi:hypothetical protein